MSDTPKDSNSLNMAVSALSDVGRRRQENEDSMLYDENLHLYVVADGMGGHVGGGMASKLAVQTIIESMRAIIAEDETDGGVVTSGIRKPESILSAAIGKASKKIHNCARDDKTLRGMGTTVVVLWVAEGKAYIAHVGDSRCYLLRRGQLLQLTDDHSLVGEQMRAGIITQEDARTHKYKNVITRSVGFQEHVDIDVIVRAVRPGDTFILCTDGLTNLISDEELADLLEPADLNMSCRVLIDAANSKGGDDNITVMLARVDFCSELADPDATEEWDEPTLQL